MNVTTRKQAKELGLKAYFTGFPCPNEHVAERRVSNGQCVECLKEIGLRQYWGNPKKGRQRAAAFRKTNPDKIKANNDKHSVITLYGITREEKEAIFRYQGECCAICRGTESGGRLGWHVDHNHKTKQQIGKRESVRGVLCCRCNTKWIAEFEKFGKCGFRYAYGEQLTATVEAYLTSPPAQKVLETQPNE